MKCAKCDSHDTERIVLAGGRHVWLCASHNAEWVEYVRTTRAFGRLVEWDARGNYLWGKCHAGEHVSQADWLSHAREKVLADTALFVISTEWLHDKDVADKKTDIEPMTR